MLVIPAHELRRGMELQFRGVRIEITGISVVASPSGSTKDILQLGYKRWIHDVFYNDSYPVRGEWDTPLFLASDDTVKVYKFHPKKTASQS